MPADDVFADVKAIRELIGRQFACLQWTPEQPPDWEGLAAGFVPDAPLYPSARPAKRQTVAGFIERMEGLRAAGKLHSFEETMLGAKILVFGNVAVALAACEMVENGSEITRDVSGFLFIKDAGTWKIAAQAWDLERETNRIPQDLSKAAAGS